MQKKVIFTLERNAIRQKNYLCAPVKKHYIYLLLLGLLAFGNQSCETPEKVMKSNDIEYKQKKAIYWYNKKEYFKCIPVFEELIGLMKGTKSTEDIYYMYCFANYKQGDYMISAYHFKNFTTFKNDQTTYFGANIIAF